MPTSNKSAAFGRLLKGAINGIANYEDKTAPTIEEELGALIGVSGKTIQRYKSGNLPPVDRDNDAVRVLAEAAVRRGFLGREWLERFLHAARYPAAEKLLDELTPAHAPRPRPERVYANLPAPTYDQFVMRQQAFAEVVDGLSQRSAAVLIVGLGGNGKTSLAREVAAHCLQDEGEAPRFDAVVWVSDKDNPGTTNQSTVLDTIVRTLDYPGFSQFAHEEKLHEVEQLLRRQKVLLIIDNAETITDGALFTWLLRLPEPSKAIITTREHHRLLRRNSTPIELRGMSEKEAHTLLQQRLERLRIAHLVHDQTQLEPLLAATGGNPKAITMVAGLLKHERRPLQQIVADLHAARGDLFDDLFSQAWALLDEAGKRILMVMTFFQDSASVEALSATAEVNSFDFDRATERLTDLSLLDVQQADLTSEPRYVLHPLVRVFAAAQLVEQADFEKAARDRWGRFFLRYVEHYGDDDLGNPVGEGQKGHREHLRTEITNIHAVIERNFATNNLQAVRMIERITTFLLDEGYVKERIDLCKRGLKITSVGNMDEQHAGLVVRLAWSYFIQGDNQEAQKIMERNEVRARSCGDNRRISHFLRDFSVICAKQGENEKAVALCAEALNIAEQIGDKLGILMSKHFNGKAAYYRGDYTEATNVLLEVLPQHRDEDDFRNIAHILLHLGDMAFHCGNLTQAREYMDDALEILHTTYYEAHLEAQIYCCLGKIAYADDDLVGAYAFYTSAIPVCERMGMRHELAEARDALVRLEAKGATMTT
jgi:tetratricopeptide (TPR) repeat protein